jgi:hypothetical protein
LPENFKSKNASEEHAKEDKHNADKKESDLSPKTDSDEEIFSDALGAEEILTANEDSSKTTNETCQIGSNVRSPCPKVTRRKYNVKIQR